MGTRIFLLIATNFAVVVVFGIAAQVFGLDKILAQNGMTGQMAGLFIHVFVIWFWRIFHFTCHVHVVG